MLADPDAMTAAPVDLDGRRVHLKLNAAELREVLTNGSGEVTGTRGDRYSLSWDPELGYTGKRLPRR